MFDLVYIVINKIDNQIFWKLFLRLIFSQDFMGDSCAQSNSLQLDNFWTLNSGFYYGFSESGLINLQVFLMALAVNYKGLANK